MVSPIVFIVMGTVMLKNIAGSWQLLDITKMHKSNWPMLHHSPWNRETTSGTLTEEHLPHIQAATSSGRMVCSTIAQINHTTQEALLDSCSTISSFTIDLV